ncbi:MAG: YggS family pyridoxal phosphate-dependent enzyme [Actinobacteria bacterium]|nr:YggS family pyridoxal phosphate-dependent enzyme [Actinomycetota bacterium]MBM3712294.1 YggS family pyridoxal phosphate-dependent enzyme [Actinomycetota bacterium]
MSCLVKEIKYKNNIDRLKKDIAETCLKTGVNPDEIMLIAASKYANAEQIEQVSRFGIDDFGENRADELIDKFRIIGNKVHWHFIGHLQSRKAKLVVPIVDYIHSIDRLSTLEKVDSEAFKNNKIQNVLLEINISGEETKFGMKPEELALFLNEAVRFKNVKVKGLMTMAPFTGDVFAIRNVFRSLNELLKYANRNFKGINLKELSMGMSNDFKIALEEGATMLRIGSLIFL